MLHELIFDEAFHATADDDPSEAALALRKDGAPDIPILGEALYPDGPRAGQCDATREDSKPLPLRDDQYIAEVKSEVKRNRQRARSKIAAEPRRE